MMMKFFLRFQKKFRNKMITINIKLKQFLEIEDLNIDDDDALEDLSDFEI